MLIVEDRPVFWALFMGVFAFSLATVTLVSLFDRAWMVALICAPIAIMLFLLFRLMLERTRVFLDAKHRQVAIRKRNTRGTTTVSYDLAHLDRAKVGVSRGETETYRVELVLSGGMDAGTMPLTQVYTSGGGHHAAAKAINNWLDAYRS